MNDVDPVELRASLLMRYAMQKGLTLATQAAAERWLRDGGARTLDEVHGLDDEELRGVIDRGGVL